MKQRILWAVYIFMVLLGSFNLVFGADYTFEEINLTAPGYPGAVITLVDINDYDDVVAQAALPDGRYVALIATAAGRSGRFKRVELFACPGATYTLPVGINNARRVTGNCDEGAFVREPNG